MLGVAPGAPPEVVRRAFLRRVRAHHPDVTDEPAGAADRTATIISAYRVLRELPPEPGRGAPTAPPPPGPGTVEVITDEAVWVGVEAASIGRALLDVADEIGEVSYVDGSGGIVQLTVRPGSGPTCWWTISIHPRPGGAVLVATLESIEARPAPDAGPLTATLAEALGRRLADPGPHS